ncbi:Unknown protein [Striga hermonthica]|uniref:Uncharacterized protein n=1 Tax=Striga hermonthica TaxID=68872 RepID=A0A9N7NJS7_STRHE|nr:Unknown protein [Striga hermonthica]
MWRKNELRLGSLAGENQDSDQSISEEEEDDLEGEGTGNMVSLDGLGSKKSQGSVQVLSQLDLLRDSYEFHSTKEELFSSHERKGGYSEDDELEFSLFDEDNCTDYHLKSFSAAHTKHNAGMLYLPTMASISHSDEEIISDDEKIDHPTIGNARGTVDCTWSEASREVEALVCLNENSTRHPSHGAFVKERKSSKGGDGRNAAKPKFVFLHDSRKEDISMVISDRHGTSSANGPTLDEIDAAAEEDADELMSDSQPICHDKESQDPENSCVPYEQAQKNDFKGLSMAEFLYSFDKSSNQLQGRIEYDIEKGQRRMQMIVKRNTSEQGDTNQAEDDPLESLDSGSPFCSDDEENHQSLQLVVPSRTMTDQFHEAFGMVSAIDEGPQVTFPRPLCGMHGKLQQVMQHEKQRDMVYLKNLSGETGFNDEKMCISVRILTRSLEAKLIVCSCAPVEDAKSSYWESDVEVKVKGIQKTLTIIFNPRVCKDVELEVGNLISIRPPWTEVPVKEKDETASSMKGRDGAEYIGNVMFSHLNST